MDREQMIATLILKGWELHQWHTFLDTLESFVLIHPNSGNALHISGICRVLSYRNQLLWITLYPEADWGLLSMERLKAVMVTIEREPDL